MIKLELTDSIATLELPILEVPLSEDTIENATDVTTLDFNVYTDFISQKRQWSHTWAYMSKTDYDVLRAFYDRQFTLFEYPTLTVAYYSIADISVRMSINTKDIISNCGELQNVTVTFRETAQLPMVS